MACGSLYRRSGCWLAWKRTSEELDSRTPVDGARSGFGGRGSGPQPKWRLVVPALPARCRENVIAVLRVSALGISSVLGCSKNSVFERCVLRGRIPFKIRVLVF